MSDDTILTGGCLCGGLRFEVSEPLQGAVYCHCKRCQRRTGSAFSMTAQAAPGSFRIVQGAELDRHWRPDDGGWEKHFCAECGSHLYTRNPKDPQQIGVRMGACDDDPGVRPGLRQFVAYAAPWEPIPDDGLPRYPERRPS